MVNSFRISQPGEIRLRSDTGALNSPNEAYSPEGVEGKFLELRQEGCPRLLHLALCLVVESFEASFSVGKEGGRDNGADKTALRLRQMVG